VAELRERRYQPSTSICFYTEKPKRREVFAAAFRDRIVHHLVYAALAPVWERVFIHHSYACRPNKGTHAAAATLQKFLRQITANGTLPAYYLKLDLHNFFMSIDRRLLFDMLAARCNDEALLWLLRVLVFHDPTQDYVLHDRDNLRHGLPPHKSLFHAPPFCGLPIGNLTSQFFANVYLNALDQFLKHELKCRYYMRYVDDVLLLAHEVERLREWASRISDFTGARLRVQLNPRATRFGLVAGGVDFAGFIVRPQYTLVRRRVVGNLKAKLRKARAQLCRSAGEHAIVWRFDEETLQKCLATVNSYLGHFKHAQARRCEARLWKEFSFLGRFFALSSHRLVRRDRSLRRVSRLWQQVRWLQKHFKGFLCLIQIGCYYEAFDQDAKQLAEAAGLKLQKRWRGFALGCGFHRCWRSKVLAKLKQQRVPLVLVAETGRELYQTKERLPQLMWEYPQPK